MNVLENDLYSKFSPLGKVLREVTYFVIEIHHMCGSWKKFYVVLNISRNFAGLSVSILKGLYSGFEEKYLREEENKNVFVKFLIFFFPNKVFLV